MATRAATKYRTAGSGMAAHSVRVEEAIRSIINLTVASATVVESSTTENGSEQVLLDTDLDGERYLLVRMPRAVQKSVQLSPREHEIVRMVAQGHPNKVIAVLLNISTWTVCTHVRRIFAKLGVGSRAAMVGRLLESGGIPGQTARSQPSVFPQGSFPTVTSVPARLPTTAQGINSGTSSESQLPPRGRMNARTLHGPRVTQRPSREPRR